MKVVNFAFSRMQSRAEASTVFFLGMDAGLSGPHNFLDVLFNGETHHGDGFGKPFFLQ
jgi:hypothetical protein